MPKDFQCRGDVPDWVVSLVCQKNIPLRFPSNLKKLVIIMNEVKTIPDFPNGLLQAFIHCPCLERLPHLPESLTVLNLTGCKSLTGTLKLPKNLQIISISDTFITDFGDTLPDTLKEMNITNTPFWFLPSLPGRFEVIYGTSSSLLSDIVPLHILKSMNPDATYQETTNVCFASYNDWLRGYQEMNPYYHPGKKEADPPPPSHKGKEEADLPPPYQENN